jgi:hypothetical protein
MPQENWISEEDYNPVLGDPENRYLWESGPLPALAGVLLSFQSHASRVRGDNYSNGTANAERSRNQGFPRARLL